MIIDKNKRYQTRSGFVVEILGIRRAGMFAYPVIGYVHDTSYKKPIKVRWSLDGQVFKVQPGDACDDHYQLVEVPERAELAAKNLLDIGLEAVPTIEPERTLKTCKKYKTRNGLDAILIEVDENWSKGFIKIDYHNHTWLEVDWEGPGRYLPYDDEHDYDLILDGE